MVRLLAIPAAAERLRAARDFVRALPPATEALLVGATREAVDDFARDCATEAGATFGLHRFSLMQLAAHLAAADLARLGLAPATLLAAEALAARAASELGARGELGYFAPVQRFPGFARALAATLTELRLGRVSAESLDAAGEPGPDLARLWREYGLQLEAAASADRAEVLRLAADAVRRPNRFTGFPLLLLDVEVQAGRERDFVDALLANAGDALITAPASESAAGGGRSWQRHASLPAADSAGDSSLAQLQRFLFSATSPPRRLPDESVRYFSAPGEARECVEIARYILDEARRGLRFDQMAVFLRQPLAYAPLLETAFRRAGIPAYFARGSSRPDGAGRAFLALLACREENLSASRFAEYLSLGQVPAGLSATASPQGGPPTVAAEDDEARTIRAPWKWEKLLVDAAVIGGVGRWERRLRGLRGDLELKLAEVDADEPDSARAAGLRRDLVNLDDLSAFALPIVELLQALPASASWGDWLPALRQLAGTTLHRPTRVLRVLEELEPMSSVGPLAVGEVARVLAERLSTLEEDPPDDRHGRVFVAPARQARGRVFAVVFVPGLAERIFPQRPREDPLLLDGLRARLSEDLRTQHGRGLDERLLLELAVGAAERCLYLSYPRLDVGEARPRVTSFYGLDVVRATRGEIPDFEQLEREAFETAGARLAWPAPPEAKRAIDAAEHDLAVLEPLLRGTDLSQAKGRAKYLLELNPWLAESLRSRYARWQIERWNPRDGLVRPSPAVLAALGEYRLRARPYSATALQRFAACPYQFLLASIYRFEPRQDPAPLEQLDPLTRGSLFHEVQAEVLRSLQRIAAGAEGGASKGSEARGLFGLSPGVAAIELDTVIARVATAYRDELAPPIARVWEDEIQAVRADLHTWLRRMAEGDTQWLPLHFEYAFGLPPDASRDPASRAEPVDLPGGWKLRGSVDLVETAPDGSVYRVTDHKTGRDPGKPLFAVGGGEVLQPVLYALAVEAATGKRVKESRLYYCTTRGGFHEYPVPLTEIAKRHGLAVLEAIDRALESGMLPPAPREKACARCDFRIVCGPYEERRSSQCKQALPELQNLRDLP